MKKKILIGITLTFVVAVAGWNINWSLKHDNTLSVALRNLVAIAEDEHNQGTGENVDQIGSLYTKNYMNDSKDCVIKEEYECRIGFTVPLSVPWIGGTECYMNYIDEVEYPGKENPCEFTGNPLHACDYYRCRKNE